MHRKVTTFLHPEHLSLILHFMVCVLNIFEYAVEKNINTNYYLPNHFCIQKTTSCSFCAYMKYATEICTIKRRIVNFTAYIRENTYLIL